MKTPEDTVIVLSRSLTAAAECPPSLASLPRLGVGLLYTPALPEFLAAHLDAVDYVELIPDTFWVQRRPAAGGGRRRYDEIPRSVEVVDWLAERRPLIAHSVGLSIGSAELFDRRHLSQMALWQRRYGFPWHSDHLSFSRIPLASHGAGSDGFLGSETEEVEDPPDLNASIAVPVPYDEEVLALFTARVREVQARIPAPFLLENNVNYVEIPEQEMSEPQFLNRLCGDTGCGLLLDVHNVYVNARNHGFDAARFVAELDLAHVVEVHVAGGNELDGTYLDSHSGACPEPVWELLAQVAGAAPNLRAVTFEMHASYYSQLGPRGILAELDRARRTWTA
jgi:uncharacterized protein (UPF0276 family)